MNNAMTTAITPMTAEIASSEARDWPTVRPSARKRGVVGARMVPVPLHHLARADERGDERHDSQRDEDDDHGHSASPTAWRSWLRADWMAKPSGLTSRARSRRASTPRRCGGPR